MTVFLNTWLWNPSRVKPKVRIHHLQMDSTLRNLRNDSFMNQSLIYQCMTLPLPWNRNKTAHISRAQFHKACKHRNLLSMKFLPWWEITKQNVICCILLVTGIELLFAVSWKSRGNLVGKSCYYQERNFMLSKFLRLQTLWSWAQVSMLKLCKTHSVKFSFHNFVDMRHKALSVTWLAGLKKNSEFSQKDFRVLLRFILKLLGILDPNFVLFS